MDSIKTEHIILRKIRWKDLSDYNEYAKVKEIGYLSGWKPHESRLDTLAVIGNIKDSPYHYAIEYNGKMIGTCSLQPDDKRQGTGCLMIGYSLNPNFHNMGLATEAAKALLELAFSKNTLSVAAYCFPENIASKRVLNKCGFNYEGTLKNSYLLYNNEIKDVECYLITEEEYNSKKQ